MKLLKNKKYHLTLFSALLLVGLLGLGISFTRNSKSNAACTNVSPTAGSSTITVNTEIAGTYNVWSRIMAADTTNNSFLLEVNSDACFNMGDQAITPNSWTWVNYRDGNSTSRVSVALRAGTNTFKLISKEPQVKVDRVLAVLNTQNCTPTGTGDNCVIQTDTTQPQVSLTSPVSGQTVGSSLNISVNASDNIGVSKVDILVDGAVVQSLNATPYTYTLSTTPYEDGPHTVAARAYDAAGNERTSSNVTITVKNTAPTPTPTPTPTPNPTPTDTQKPSSPSNMQRTLGLDWVRFSYYLDINWKASTDNKGVSQYVIKRNGRQIGTSKSTNFKDYTIEPGIEFTYSVEAQDAAGNISDPAKLTAKGTCFLIWCSLN